MVILISKDDKGREETEEYESLDKMYESMEDDLSNHDFTHSFEHFNSLKELVAYIAETTDDLEDFFDLLSIHKKMIGNQSFPLSICYQDCKNYCAAMDSDDWKNYIFGEYRDTFFRFHKFVGIEENVIEFEELCDSKKSVIVEKIMKRHSDLVEDYELDIDDVKNAINYEYFFKDGSPATENYSFGPFNPRFHNFENYDWKRTLES